MRTGSPTSGSSLLLAIHLVCLVLAASALTLITAPLGGGTWSWSFFEFAYRSGWGYPYQSDFSLPQICAYVAAYGTGVIFYLFATRRTFLDMITAGVCLAGLVSFVIEASHWTVDHHLSVILSAPIAPLVVGIYYVVTLFRQPRAREVAA